MFWPQQQNAQKVSNRCVKAQDSLIVLKVLSNPNQSIDQSINFKQMCSTSPAVNKAKAPYHVLVAIGIVLYNWYSKTVGRVMEGM